MNKRIATKKPPIVIAKASKKKVQKKSRPIDWTEAGHASRLSIKYKKLFWG